MTDDLMPTFRQKIKLNNEELIFFHQDVNSWREKLKDEQEEEPSTLEDICYDLSSEDDSCNDPAEDLMKEGNKCLTKGEWTRAISFYSSAISRKNNEARYYANRAMCYLKRNSPTEAENDCTQAIHLNPAYKKAYFRRAYARKLLGKWKKSCDDFEVILKMEPDNRIALVEYEAMLEYIQKDLLTSEAVQDDVKRHEKAELAAKTKLGGNKLIENGDYAGAKEKFTTAIKLDPSDPTFFANRAICHMKLMDFKKAEIDCDKALELDRKYVKVYTRRARIRRKLGKLYGARQDLYNAYELNPEDSAILNELGEVNEMIKNSEDTRRKKGIVVEEVEVVSLLDSKKVSGDTYKIIIKKWDELRKEKCQLGVNESKHEAKSVKENHSIPRAIPKGDNELITTARTNGFGDSRESQNEQLDRGTKDISVSAKTIGLVNENIVRYDMKEVFPLKHNDPAAKFSGPFVKIRVEDAKFAVPEKLLEIPDGFIL
ncbi:hypothetical protein GE061_011178 [Apolygus lucorum]|uniref:RNA-polymerase II-associated protein 3-like C-terminal domain-containing protein n=1 Tax=Apolygus lucorum TaxID=248454 RepID=A0A8S9XY51_APOLU|nr:hypothetical protein GE061_011178 [Apolygus lucorum]